MDDFKEFIDELLAKTDIVQVVSRYVPLKAKGNRYWGCCPFHHEKDPSFSVESSKQFYHCFGCKESGNALTFVQKMESVDFMDAVRILAEAAHMEIPTFKGAGRNVAAEREKKKRLCELMKQAARHYFDNLSHPSAKTAREYLERRGIDRKLTVKFGLGYSINGNEIIEYLESKGYKKAEMLEAGLIAQRADSYYDVFYGRVMYPIIDNFGDVVAFGGRTLKPDYEYAKYRNSSQTLIFDKSRNIYGINLLKKRKQQARIDSVIITEGYMDVIALHKGGFDTAVASMGTALTGYQAKLLKNYANRVYISYDGDAAGQKATLRGLDILADAGLSVRIVELPDGLDPDDMIQKRGAQAYQKLLDEALTLPAFKIKTLKKAHDLTDPEGKSKFAVEAINVIRKLSNPVEQEEYINLVQSYTGYSKQVLMRQAELSFESERSAEAAKVPASSHVRTAQTSYGGEDKAAIFVLASLAAEKSYARFEESPDFLPENGAYRELYCAMQKDYLDGGVVRTDSMFSVLGGEGQALLARVAGYEFLDGDGTEKYNDCVRSLKVRRLESEIERLNSEMGRTANAENRNEMLKELSRLTRKLKDVKSDKR